MAPTQQDVLHLIEREGIELVDLKFSDLHGTWQHFTITSAQLNADAFAAGVAFDGSSIRGWQSIEESDMAMVPDPGTAWVDPFHAHRTLSLICTIRNPRTGASYRRCPRSLARRAADHLRSSGLADAAWFGPEPEFFLFDDVRYDSGAGGSFYQVDSIESPWNTGRLEEGGNLAYKIPHRLGYLPVSPADTLHDMRSEMLLTLASLGVVVEKHHHEVAAAQHELGLGVADLLTAADQVMVCKYVVRNVARKYGKTATFMPKPVGSDNGSGMHVHQSLWKEGQPLFHGEGTYADLSQTARWYIGGLLRHAPSLLAFTNPSTNSYRRLVPGFEAPVHLAYSRGNRSAAVRIPLSGPNPRAKRLEFRTADPLANPYLAFAAMLLAGLDGILNRIDPGPPIDEDLFHLSPEERQRIPAVPSSLEAALDALRDDRSYLLAGGVFDEEFLDHWIELKLDDVRQLRQRPHPHEFSLYYDA